MELSFPKWISPSLLSADFSILKEEVHAVAQAGAELIHVDVMDGHFVPNLTIGMTVVKSLKKISPLPLDVHLMIEKPEKYIEQFIQAGSDYLTLHIESTSIMSENLKKIKSLGVKAGITLKPKTSFHEISPFLDQVDLVLIMTVEPGFGGQSFMQDQVEKIEILKKYRAEKKLQFLIEVDGGVDSKTSQICWNAGADILVAGSAVFNGVKSEKAYQDRINLLRPQNLN
jgi:ribulose-phosphate 3-epimerase